MPAAELVIEARWLLPVAPENRVLHDHAVVVGGGRILDVLPTSAAAIRYAGVPRQSRLQHVVLPGFVNAHTHAAMALLRGFADDVPLDPWLRDRIWPAEQRWMSNDFVDAGSRLAIAEMLLGGTTCFADMYFFTAATANAAAAAGIRAVVGIVVVEFPSPWAEGPTDYLQRGLSVRDDFRGHPLVRFGFSPHAPYTASDETLTRVRVLGDELELPVMIHVSETAAEVAESRERYGAGPLLRLDRLGLVGPQLVAVHLTQTDTADIDLLAQRSAHVVHCPESNLKLASGFCPVAKLRGAGVNVALGTDGAASNNDLDMLGELRSAALLAKGVAADPTALSAADALRMATLDGARALGLGDEIGSIQPGKSADLVAVSLRHPATQPVHDALSQIVYSASRDQVTDVWIAGRQVVADRVLLTLDVDDVLARGDEWRARVQGSSVEHGQR